MGSQARPVNPLLAPILAGAAVAIAVVPIFLRGFSRPGSAPHFQLQAQAFLHGRLDLGVGGYDTILYHGQHFLPFGPLPAVLLMPFVALIGTSVPMAVLTVPAAAAAGRILSRLFAALGHAPADRAWLVLASLAGTVYLSSLGLNSSYFAAHVVAFLCVSGALLLATKGRAPLAAGVLVSLAGLTRSPEFLAALPVAVLYGRGEALGLGAAGRSWTRAALVIAGAFPGVALTLLFNAARFGSPMESGYALQILTDPTLAAARQRGLVSLVHLPKNLYYLLIASPLPRGAGGNEAVLSFPFVKPSPWGMGIVFVSPWLLAIPWARGRLAATLAFATALLLLPSLLYYGIGWIQFGYRYGLDAAPFAVALAALAYQRPAWRKALPYLAVLSILVNVWGAYWLSGAVS
jgi:hypothetical protein